MSGDKVKQVAIYLRVSTDGQTTDNQRHALEAVAQRREWRIVKAYEDAAISGSKGRDKRPGFDAMMKDAAGAASILSWYGPLTGWAAAPPR